MVYSVIKQTKSIRSLIPSINGKVLNGTIKTINTPKFNSTWVNDLSNTSTLSNEDFEKNSAAISAFLARLNINFSDPNLIKQVLTHKSYAFGESANNERLRYIGKKAMGLYVAEYFHVKYPNLPPVTIEEILRVHFDHRALASIGKSFGLDNLVLFKKEQTEDDKPFGPNKVVGKSLQALIGAIYHDKGAKAAKDFIHSYLLSRDIDPVQLLPLNEPKRTLSILLNSKGKEQPIARLLKETGRLSNRPIFVVGIFSDTVKLGEGYGSSLKMAEFRACKDTLVRYYMDELKDFQLPSITEGGPTENDITFFPSKVNENPSRIY